MVEQPEQRIVQALAAQAEARHTPRWIQSSEYNTTGCMHCNCALGKGITRLSAQQPHHCRYCGFAVCGDCSNKVLQLERWLETEKPHKLRTVKSDTQLRVCFTCYDHLTMPAPEEPPVPEPTTLQPADASQATQDGELVPPITAALQRSPSVGRAEDLFHDHLIGLGVITKRAQELASRLLEEGYTTIAEFEGMSTEERQRAGFKSGDLKKVLSARNLTVLPDPAPAPAPAPYVPAVLAVPVTPAAQCEEAAIEAIIISSAGYAVLSIFIALTLKYGLRIWIGVEAGEVHEMIISPTLKAAEEAALAKTGWEFYTNTLEAATGSTIDGLLKCVSAISAVYVSLVKLGNQALAAFAWIPGLAFWWAVCEINDWNQRERHGLDLVLAFLFGYVIVGCTLVRNRPSWVPNVRGWHAALQVGIVTLFALAVAGLFYDKYHSRASDRCELPSHEDMSTRHIRLKCDWQELWSDTPITDSRFRVPFEKKQPDGSFDTKRYFLDGGMSNTTLSECEIECRYGFEPETVAPAPELDAAEKQASWLRRLLGTGTIESKKNKFVITATAGQLAQNAGKMMSGVKEVKKVVDLVPSGVTGVAAGAATGAASAAAGAASSAASAAAGAFGGVTATGAAPVLIPAAVIGGAVWYYKSQPGETFPHKYMCAQGRLLGSASTMTCKEQHSEVKLEWKQQCPEEFDACMRRQACSRQFKHNHIDRTFPWSSSGDETTPEYMALKECFDRAAPSNMKWIWSSRVQIPGFGWSKATSPRGLANELAENLQDGRDDRRVELRYQEDSTDQQRHFDSVEAAHAWAVELTDKLEDDEDSDL